MPAPHPSDPPSASAPDALASGHKAVAVPWWRQAWQAVPRAALGNLVAKLLMVGLGLSITVLVARQGPQVQGAFALFVAVESAMVTLFTGLGLWLARQVSRQQAQPVAVGQAVAAATPAQRALRLSLMLRGALQWAVGLGVLASLLLLAVSWSVDRMPYAQLWLLALAAPFLLMVPTATGLWLGQGRMWPLNVAQVAAPLSVLSGMAAVAWLTQAGALKTPAVVLVLMAWVSGKSLVAVLTALYAVHDAARQDAANGPASPAPPGADGTLSWRQDGRFVLIIGLTNLVSLLNYRASLFLVEHFKGLGEVGTYSVAVTVAELLWLLSSSVTVSAYSRIGNPDRAIASSMTVQAVRINVLATAAAAPVLLVGAWWGLPLVMGPAYAASLWPLAALLPGVAAYAAASSLSAFYTNHLGRPQLSGSIAALSLSVSFLMGCLLVPRWGALGAGVASSLGYVTAIVAAYGVFLRHAGLPLRALWRA